MSGPVGHSRTTAVLAGLATIALCGRAQAGDHESDARRVQAQEVFEQGQKLADSDPKRALSAYRASWQIHPDARVHYAVAKVCAKIGDTTCVATSYELYLKEGGADLPAARRKEVEAALKAVTKNTGSLAIKANVAGAYIKLDGVVLGRTPMEKPILVPIGTHKIVLVSGGNVIEKSVQIERGGSETVELEVKKEEKDPAPVAEQPAPAPAPPPPVVVTAAEEPKAAPPPPAGGAKRRGVPILPWAIAGTLAAGTGVAAFFMFRAQSDYDELRGKYPISRAALDEAHDTGRNFLILTAALGAATAVAAGVAGLSTLARGKDAAPDRAIAIGVGPGGIALTGRIP